MKVCEQCGHEFEGELCPCEQVEVKDNEHSRQWFIILFLVIVLCVLSFIYVKFTKPKPCTELNDGVSYSQNCFFDEKEFKTNQKNNTVSNIIDAKTNQPITIDDIGE